MKFDRNRITELINEIRMKIWNEKKSGSYLSKLTGILEYIFQN
jgi:hypothetical protein